jgi:hypothetical protein
VIHLLEQNIDGVGDAQYAFVTPAHLEDYSAPARNLPARIARGTNEKTDHLAAANAVRNPSTTLKCDFQSRNMKR